MSFSDFISDPLGALFNFATQPSSSPVLQQAAAYQQQPQQTGLQKVIGALQGFTNATENQPLEHLSKLASVAPQYYGGAYASALAGQADKTGQQLKQAQVQSLVNPMSDPTKALELAIQQSKLQQEQTKARQADLERQILSGVSSPESSANPGSLSDYAPANSNAPLNQRNNNPGNLKDPQTGAFRTFATPEDGMAANLADLQYKISGDSPAMKAKFGNDYTPTLSNLISTWAPASDNNDPKKYADFVSQRTGIPVNQPLKLSDASVILPAISQFEGGQYQAPQPTTQAKTVESSALAKLGQLAAINPEKYGLEYTKAQIAAEKEQKKNEDSVINDQNANLTGQAFLDTLPDRDVKNKAQALLDGRAPYPTVNSRTPTSIKKALEAAQQADPTYSNTTAPVRMQTSKSYAPGGQNGQILQSIGTASGHLADLQQAYDKLNNGNWTVVNYATNKLSKQSENARNDAISKFNTALNAVAPELAKISSGSTQIAEGEVNKRRDAFDYDMPPQAFKSAMTEAASLIKSRSDTLLDTYKQVMGDRLPPTAPKYSQKTLNNFKNLGVDFSSPGEVGNTITLDEFLRQ